MSTLVLAEKPSVARDIASVVGARERHAGFFTGAGYVVSWAVGHLVALGEPGDMNASWKKWRLGDLPLLPVEWPLVVVEATRDQFETVRRLIRSRDVHDVVCATDAGREGELIFRYIYDAAGADRPVRRLWISSLTPDAITAGFRSLKDGKAFDRLADAARARSRADWLVGMNLSRAYSLTRDDHLSVGRVQTPTLAMIVEREIAVRDFVREEYLEVVARFGAPASGGEGGAKDDEYRGTFIDGPTPRDAKRFPPDGAEAAKVVDRARRGLARVLSVTRKSKRLPPPLLYDLAELQRHANRLFGFTAHRTLELAQSLYERYKLTSYPRTDSRHLSTAVAATLPEVVAAIREPYASSLAPATGVAPLGRRFVDDAKVTDHHAIIPTSVRPPADLPPDERAVYDLVCRRLLSAWHDDHVDALTNVVTAVSSSGAVDHYVSRGTSVEVQGWKVLDLPSRHRKAPRDDADAPPDQALPGGLEPGLPRRVVDVEAVKKETRPPPWHTDATLLTAMETAGRAVEEEELSRAMRDRGLGTPATRAAILETLLRREYVARDGKSLRATEKGMRLVAMVHPHVKSPAMTGEWEAKLARIERGEESMDGFMRAIEGYVTEVVGLVTSGAAADPTSRSPGSFAPPSPRRDSTGSEGGGAPEMGRSLPLYVSPETRAPFHAPPSLPGEEGGRGEGVSGEEGGRGEGVSGSRRPARPTDLGTLLRSSFGFAEFRPFQEDVCRAVADGRDVLLVMPTGAGKSLCYQLPGVARGGTTLVVSPLIALMEDQVAQLVARGFAADRIHSGRDRAASRRVCRDYLDGALDFMFIAPERLKVPGFPEMLARRRPTLVAVDEAHCISVWGHDFRPEYRMLGDRLPMLRPCPVIALTATATPAVQQDIVEQLRLAPVERFIHGFRRTNIGVEVVEMSPRQRDQAVLRLLADSTRRPAIVYAPTRKESERLAGALGARFRAAPYHAGLQAGVRDEVQGRFLASDLDVVVATTAFGMGIDKADVRTVVHTAIPATVEGYYQEIGRAGRDGAESRAVLLHSFVDTRTHEFFLERDYPPAEVLASLFEAIPPSGCPSTDLAGTKGVSPDVFEKALEKLWVHGGAQVDPDGFVERGSSDWRRGYEAQRAHKEDQIARMRRFAETASCRMLQLVGHFGDQCDSGEPCGICDVCAPSRCVVQSFRGVTSDEQQVVARVIEALRERDGLSVGQIHRDSLGGLSVDRRTLEHVLGALSRAGDVRLVGDEFTKDGRTIAFQRVHLASRLRAADAVSSDLRVTADVDAPAGRRRGARRAPEAGRPGRRGRSTNAEQTRSPALPTASTKGEPRRAPQPAPDGVSLILFEALRVWRKQEAHRRRVLAFRILPDRTLLAIVDARPKDDAALLRVSGIGPTLLEKYGRGILAILNHPEAPPRGPVKRRRGR